MNRMLWSSREAGLRSGTAAMRQFAARQSARELARRALDRWENEGGASSRLHEPEARGAAAIAASRAGTP
jgi:hypothetical protein